MCNIENFKEGEYGWCTFYIRVNMEHSSPLKSLEEGNQGKKENNGGDEPV
jgi:hypothetical protein